MLLELQSDLLVVLWPQTAPQLGAEVIKRCMNHSHLKADDVDMVYMGQVLTTGAGQNPARQVAIQAEFQKIKLQLQLIRCVDQD